MNPIKFVYRSSPPVLLFMLLIISGTTQQNKYEPAPPGYATITSSNIPLHNQPHNITGSGVLKCCVVEIRSYNLVPNKRPEFHQLIVEEALPLVDRWETDLVAYGRSRHDKDSYYVIRAYKSLTDREENQQAFYGSSEWRDGPREKILSMIENYTTVVLNMDRATIDAIRANFEKTGERNPD